VLIIVNFRNFRKKWLCCNYFETFQNSTQNEVFAAQAAD